MRVDINIFKEDSLFVLLLRKRVIEEVKMGLTEELEYYKTALEYGDNTVTSDVYHVTQELEEATDILNRIEAYILKHHTNQLN